MTIIVLKIIWSFFQPNFCKIFFFRSYHPLIITPLRRGLTVLKVSSYLGPFLHSSYLLHRWLSLIADSVFIGCSVGCVELCILIHLQIRAPICSGYIPFHSEVSLFDDSFSDSRLLYNPHIRKTWCQVFLRINHAWKILACDLNVLQSNLVFLEM